jgi:hypothetical protein
MKWNDVASNVQPRDHVICREIATKLQSTPFPPVKLYEAPAHLQNAHACSINFTAPTGLRPIERANSNVFGIFTRS